MDIESLYGRACGSPDDEDFLVELLNFTSRAGRRYTYILFGGSASNFEKFWRFKL